MAQVFEQAFSQLFRNLHCPCRTNFSKEVGRTDIGTSGKHIQVSQVTESGGV